MSMLHGHHVQDGLVVSRNGEGDATRIEVLVYPDATCDNAQRHFVLTLDQWASVLDATLHGSRTNRDWQTIRRLLDPDVHPEPFDAPEPKVRGYA